MAKPVHNAEQEVPNGGLAMGANRISQCGKSIARHWVTVLLTFVLVSAAGILLAWSKGRPVYHVTGAIRVAPVMTSILGAKDRGAISNYEDFVYTQARLITSNQVVQWVADALADKNLSFFQDKPTGIVTKLRRKLKNRETNREPANMLKNAISRGVVTAVYARGTELIEVSMKSTKPDEAKQIVNAFVSAYMTLEGSRSIRDEDNTLGILESERKRLAQQLNDHRDKLRTLAQQYGTTTLGGRQDMARRRVDVLLAELTRIEVHRINLEAQVKFLQQTELQTITPDVVIEKRTAYVDSDPSIQALTQRIVDFEIDYVVARAGISPEETILEHQAEVLDALKTHLAKRREEVGKAFDQMIAARQTGAHRRELLAAQAELQQTIVHEKYLREVLNAEDTQTIQLGRTQLDIQDLQFQLNFDQQQYEAVCRRIRELEMERKSPARMSIAHEAEVVSVQEKRGRLSVVAVLCGLGASVLAGIVRGRPAAKSA
jgi:uncharacterized protein involved in exopolysaccharide biosynthesis